MVVLDQYMSQSEYESEVLHNFELNSNTSVTMLPNHGYTSGFTDGMYTKKQKLNAANNSKVLIDEDHTIVEEALKSKPSSRESGGK